MGLFRNQFTQGTTHWTSYYELPQSVYAVIPPPPAFMDWHAPVVGDLLRAFHVICRTARWKERFGAVPATKEEAWTWQKNAEIAALAPFAQVSSNRLKPFRGLGSDQVYPEWLLQRMWGTWTWPDFKSQHWFGNDAEHKGGQVYFRAAMRARSIPSTGMLLHDELPSDLCLPTQLVNFFVAWMKRLDEARPGFERAPTNLVLWAPFS